MVAIMKFFAPRMVIWVLTMVIGYKVPQFLYKYIEDFLRNVASKKHIVL